ARRDDDPVAEAQQPTGSLGDRELPRSEYEFAQVIGLGSRERRCGQASFELGDPGLCRAEIGGVTGRSHHAIGRLQSARAMISVSRGRVSAFWVSGRGGLTRCRASLSALTGTPAAIGRALSSRVTRV